MDNKLKDITLAQANKLTQSRYDFSLVEKRAVYIIIKNIREQFIESEGQRDLLDNLIVRINTKDLQSTDTKLEQMYKGLKSLRKKDIYIEDEEQVLCVGYINYFEHSKRESFVEVEVSKKILPYLIMLAEKFTTYKLTVAISLKTKYGQRFYEYCSQFKDAGGFYVSIPNLRHKMQLENQYPRYASLKKYVIDVAHKELKKTFDNNASDLCFEYTEDRTGRTVQGIKVKVITKENQPTSSLSIDDQIYMIRTWLNGWLMASKRPKNKEWIETKMRYIVLNAVELVPKLHKRLHKLHVQSNVNHAAMARHIIEEDFTCQD